jgi:hypothetical protein
MSIKICKTILTNSNSDVILYSQVRESRESRKGGGDTVSELEKDLMERVAKMPPELKQRFLDKAEGAAMALDTMQKENESTSDDRERSGDNNS